MSGNNDNSGSASNDKIAAILVRGMVKVTKTIKDTLLMLGLTRKNTCVLLENNVVNKGMLQKVKDFITWGEVDAETVQKLIASRGQEFKGRLTDSKGKYQYRHLEADGKKYLKYFRLNPPQKGFGRKGIKVGFNAGGGLGYRGTHMNDLLLRML